MRVVLFADDCLSAGEIQIFTRKMTMVITITELCLDRQVKASS